MLQDKLRSLEPEALLSAVERMTFMMESFQERLPPANFEVVLGKRMLCMITMEEILHGSRPSLIRDHYLIEDRLEPGVPRCITTLLDLPAAIELDAGKSSGNTAEDPH